MDGSQRRAVGFDDGCGGGPGVCACCCGVIALLEASLPLGGRLVCATGWTDVPLTFFKSLSGPRRALRAYMGISSVRCRLGGCARVSHASGILRLLRGCTVPASPGRKKGVEPGC